MGTVITRSPMAVEDEPDEINPGHPQVGWVIPADGGPVTEGLSRLLAALRKLLRREGDDG